MSNKKVTVIAEAGVNHNGDIKLAFQLIDVAVNSGADYVKFQTFKASKLVSSLAKQAEYQKQNLGSGEQATQFEMLSKLEMPEEWHYLLKDYAEKKGIRFLSTGFDVESIDFLDRIGMDLFKIPSGEITNLPYLENIATKLKPVIISTGMSDMLDIANAINVFLQKGYNHEQITILHCNTEYPTPMEDVNLGAMNTIRKKFSVQVGYSDHTLGIEVPIAAVALGAIVIEKHFTLDRSLPGPDHKASLEPEELAQMVHAIRNIELAISGSGIKAPSKSEQKNIIAARKSIYLNKNLHQGHILTSEDFIMKRTGEGISPMRYKEIVGKKLLKNLLEGHQLNFSDFFEFKD